MGLPRTPGGLLDHFGNYCSIVYETSNISKNGRDKIRKDFIYPCLVSSTQEEHIIKRIHY